MYIFVIRDFTQRTYLLLAVLAVINVFCNRKYAKNIKKLIFSSNPEYLITSH